MGVTQLPPGFVLDEPQAENNGLPPGFVLDAPRSQPRKFSDLSLLGKALTPGRILQEGVGNRVTRDVQAAQDTLATSPINQAMEAGTSLPLRVLKGSLTRPETIGQTVGAGVDPLNWLGVKFGAPAATKAAQATGKGLAATGRGVQAAREVARHPIDFLKGSPKRIDEANRATHEVIRQFRQGGAMHDPFFEQMGQLSDKAWAPMKQLANAVDEPTTVGEIIDELNKMYPDDPIRVKEVATMLRGTIHEARSNVGVGSIGRTAGVPKYFNGPELEQLSSTIGKVVPKGVKQGKMAPTQMHAFRNDARTAISNLLEAKAPSEYKGFASQAKQQWASYKANQQKLYDVLKPSAAKEFETKGGVEFVERAGTGNLTQTEKDFLTWMQQEMPDLAQQLGLRIQQSGKASRFSKAGTFVSKEAAPKGALGGALLYLLGRK